MDGQPHDHAEKGKRMEKTLPENKNDNKLKEPRKHKYLEEKRKYQVEIRKEKFKSWKEYSYVTASSNPWSQVYKFAAGKVRNKQYNDHTEEA